MKLKHSAAKIQEAIEHLEYVGIPHTQLALAKSCNVSHKLVWNWLNNRTLISIKHCLKIEEITKGGVKAIEIRPDLEETIDQLKKMAKVG